MKTELIAIFNNPADLIREYSNDHISDDIMKVLDYVNDFEGFAFTVIGDEVITSDGMPGMILGRETIADFILNSINYARRELSDEN